MTDEPLSSSTPRSWSWVAKAGMIFLTGCVVLCSGITGWYVVSRGKHQARLNAVLERIRAAGDPLTGDELDAYYVVPADEVDLTAEYVAAVRMFENLKLVGPAAALPIVGTGGEAPLPDQPWEARAEAEAYLQSVQPQLDALRMLAMKRGRVRYPVKLGDGIAALLPDAQRLREAARRLQLEYYARLHRGERGPALESLAGLVRLGETLRDEPIMISQLVRIAVFSMATNAARDFVGAGTPDERELQTLAELFADVDFHRSLGRSFRGERSFAYITLNSDLSAGQLASGGSPNGGGISMKRLSGMRPGDSAQIFEFQTEMVEAAERPLPEAIRALRKVSQDVKASVQEDQRRLPWDRNYLAALLLPAVDAYTTAVGRGAALREATLAMIAIERYRLKHGRLPAKLEDVAPDSLPVVPADPFTGGPLLLVVDDEDYTVYSVGADGIDNGGLIAAPQGQPPDMGLRVKRGPVKDDP